MSEPSSGCLDNRTRIWPSSDPVLEEQTEILFDHFMKHVVCLNIEYVVFDDAGKRSNEEHFWTISCFVISLEGIWFLATAGHVIQKLEKLLEEKRIEILSCSIADYFQKDAPFQFSTPFPLVDAERAYIYHQTTVLDFALIYISPWFQQGLEKNKIVPLTERMCSSFDKLAFVKFILVGFPESIVADFNAPKSPGDRDAFKLAPCLMSVKRITDESTIPSSVMLPGSQHTFFVGQIEHPTYPDIVGMSGGPIFGLIETSTGGFEYAPVAIQSGWFGKHGIITATPAVVFANIAGEAIRMKKALAANDSV